MTQLRSRAVLNRALFDVGPLDSAALAVRGWILHRFDAPGRYRVAVRRGGKTRGWITVDVDEAHPARQINLDLSRWDTSTETGGRDSEQPRQLAPGGVMIFQPKRGRATYSLRISSAGADGAEFVFDTRQGLPAGDLFGVALAVAGTYQVAVDDAPLAIIHVRTPDPPCRNRASQPLLLRTGERTPRLPVRYVEIGSTVVIFLDTAGRVLVRTLSTSAHPKPETAPRTPDIHEPHDQPGRSST